MLGRYMLGFLRFNLAKSSGMKTEFYKLAQVFSFIFILVLFETIKLPLFFSSASTVEQWSNLLPNFFTGNQDFLFSYGPLYWLEGSSVVQYSRLTYWVSVIFISAYTALNWSLLFRLATIFKGAIFLAIIYAVFVKYYNASPVFFTLPFFLILYLDSIGCEKIFNCKAFIICMGLLVAFLFYLRFFYGMVSLLTIGSYLFSIHALKLKCSSLLFFTITTVLFYIAFGLAIFHDPNSVINYTVINSQLNFGNSVDMNYDVNIKSKAYFIVLCTLVCFNLFLLKFKSSFILTVNGLFIIFLKIGFSRADHYISYFILPISLFSIIFILCNNKYYKLFTPVVLLLMFYLGNISIYDGAPKITSFTPHEDFNQSFKDRAAGRYPQFKIPPDILSEIGGKSIDIYPYNNEYAIANKLNYVHRPSFQNYMTLTPVLDQLNVDFYSGDKAPEYVMWTGSIMCSSKDCNVFDDFDGKYVLNEDPLTTLSILNNYEVVKLFNDLNNKPIMLMHRKKHLESVKIQRVGAIGLNFGEWVKVPYYRNAIIKLKPELKLTVLARLQNMFLHGSVLYVNYKLSSGEVKRYRLNIINSKSGVWASPILNEFPFKGERVVEIMFETSDKHYFKPSFKAQWELYKFDGIVVNESTVPKFSEEKPQGYSEFNSDCDASIDSIKQSHITIDGIVETRLNSAGWAAFSIKHNLNADLVWLTLTDSRGNKVYVPTTKTSRADVASHFNKSNLTESGYKILSDVTEFKGQYNVSLAIAGEGKLLQCTNIKQSITLQ